MFENLTKKFHSISQWNLFGSMFFESIKLINQFFLLKFMTLSSYGKLGSIFSIVFLFIHLIGFEAESSLSPFISDATESQKGFKNFFLKYFTAQFFLLLIGSCIYIIIFYNKFELSLIVIPTLLILLEGIRILFRALLHILFLSKKTILIETALTFLFIGIIWLPFFVTNQLISIPTILGAYLLTSLLALIFFFKIIKDFYNTLPEETINHRSTNTFKRILKIRLYNSLIKIPENIFSENFIVPFFAFKFGYSQAGIFKIASYIARSIKSIIHSVIGFSGGGLFASLKKESLQIKQKAFYILSNKLNRILIFMLIFLTINYNYLMSKLYSTQTVILATILFLIYAISEHLLTIYEQFYVLEETIEKLFIIKTLEISFFSLILYFGKNFSPIEFCIMLLAVRTVIFFTLALDAFTRWGLKINTKISWPFFLITTAISIFFYFLTFLLFF